MTKREYYEKNKERILAQAKRRYATLDRDKRNADAREYYRKNKGRIREQQKQRDDSDPERKLAKGRRYRAVHAQKITAYRVKYEKNNRQAIALTRKARDCGCTIEELKTFLAANGNQERCSVCGDPFKEPLFRHRHIDHCHKTNKLRGVLCRFCNLALGHAKDSIPRLEALIAYLRKHGK